MQICSRRCKKHRKKGLKGKTSDLQTLGYGVSGKVLAIDDYKVIKTPFSNPRSLKDIATERQAYRRLSKCPSPHITKCYDYDNPDGIVLERLDQTVRRRLKELDSIPTGDDVGKWVLQAARGIAFLHSRNIVQADVGCHNMLLDSTGNLKLCDFSGCSIDGKDASVSYEPWSQLPSVGMPNRRADIFALGSAMYEMATGQRPYHDVPEYEISRRYEALQFPDDFPASRDERLWTVIMACWTDDHKTADEVVTNIEQISLHTNGLQKVKRSLTGMTLVSTLLESSFNSTRSPRAARIAGPNARTDADRLGTAEIDRLKSWKFCPCIKKRNLM